MKSQKCLKEFDEKDIQESHDIPIYMFNGNKNEADKHGRHNLCVKYEWLCCPCHKNKHKEYKNGDSISKV